MALPLTTHHLALLLVLLTVVFSPLCFAKCHPDDEAGLLAFKSGFTEDPSGIFTSWIPSTDCCRWSRLSCINSDRVTDLDLSASEDDPPNRFLTGTISPLLFTKVRQLSHILIDGLGNITGSLPKDIFNLPRLQYVYISHTKLSGPIVIDIGPKSDQLLQLSLFGNHFTGSIPNSIAQFTSLVTLDLNYNKFSGGIPNGIGHLRNLTHLALGNNQLSGVIPDFFNSFPLRELDFAYNKLSGGIPPSLSFLAPQLRFMWAQHNRLTGRIPAFFGDFKVLIGLDLSYNLLSGPIPPTIKFSIESFQGNDHLCGSPLPPCKK